MSSWPAFEHYDPSLTSEYFGLEVEEGKPGLRKCRFDSLSLENLKQEHGLQRAIKSRVELKQRGRKSHRYPGDGAGQVPEKGGDMEEIKRSGEAVPESILICDLVTTA